MKDRFIRFIDTLQQEICERLEALDQKARFREDEWSRPEGGGGRSRVISGGKVFEKGGVNTSVVYGELPELIRQRFGVKQGWFTAAGISLVIHPESPMIPTVHANYRYFELYDEQGGEIRDAWFGGGADLTPYYLADEDARHFHRIHRDACDKIDTRLYPTFKQQCDQYFHNVHREEARGVGGIFYDYMRPSEVISARRGGVAGSANTRDVSGGGLGAGPDPYSYEELLQLAVFNGQAFLDAYCPIVERNMNKPWNQSQRYWQEIRRGRYVEFNLIHDRGTLFGLKTDGRVESILMSLPPRVRWDYNLQPEPGTEEFRLVQVLKNPIDWV